MDLITLALIVAIYVGLVSMLIIMILIVDSWSMLPGQPTKLIKFVLSATSLLVIDTITWYCIANVLGAPIALVLLVVTVYSSDYVASRVVDAAIKTGNDEERVVATIERTS